LKQSRFESYQKSSSLSTIFFFNEGTYIWYDTLFGVWSQWLVKQPAKIYGNLDCFLLQKRVGSKNNNRVTQNHGYAYKFQCFVTNHWS
jgi:hypothetical protein